ncbi:GxxExxY protein [Gloeocapsopsis dulcis]|uniref:GxxExxY protein n=1 Tax=Gloeocapsopsis dulcis AAB1 = 1H9 TaxID=1433147 RepID=A0A6N8FZY3_9CHRO|nr:GxxExxY protein [Gloeocapsopsis dulcis]MUL38700.1 GxxExxY protein [Gloeocapsopsis dulcis AAB1 = 1H9]WNN88883.1 GxxExxY protein [Gloeocapsopsis dulcis]
MEGTNHKDTKDTKGRLEEGTEQLAYAVIGAAIEVHRVLGPGFLERVYQEALVVEFLMRGIPHQVQKPIAVEYKGNPIGEGKLDFLVGNTLIIELKAVEKLAPIHEAQVLSYLKMTGCPLALLINFNAPLLRNGIKRIIL